MAKGLGNNPLAGDELIRSTEPTPPARPKSPKVQPVTTASLVAKSIQIDSLLNERLRQYSFDSRRKEVQVIRDALHKYLAENGY